MSSNVLVCPFLICFNGIVKIVSIKTYFLATLRPLTLHKQPVLRRLFFYWSKNMIPKIVHYVWLGHGEKSEKIKTCIESWHKYLPDYEFIKWNEDNFDINYNAFTKKSYEEKQYAFTSDVIRLYALYNYGGIYLDTDVLLYKPLDEFLNDEGFTGFEDTNYPVTATMGCEKGNPVIKLMLDYYDCVDFIRYPVWTDFIKYQETSTCIYSNILGILGINRQDKDHTQKIKHFTVYPQSYFFTQGEGWTWHSFSGSWGV